MSKRSERSEIMLCYPLEERRLIDPKFGWHTPVYVQPKLDGIRCRMLIEPDQIMLLSSECNLISSLPHINAAAVKQFSGMNRLELDGELYSHGMPFEKICSIVNRNNVHKRHAEIKYHVFDIIVNDVQQQYRLSLLQNIFKTTEADDKIVMVETQTAKCLSDIYEKYDYFVLYGYEGIIIRDPEAYYIRKRSNKILKFKPKKMDIYTVVKVLEAVSKDGYCLNMIGKLVVCDPEGNEFTIGAGTMKHELREHYWYHDEEIIGKDVTVQYQSRTAKDGLRFGLFFDFASDLKD